MPGWLYAQQNGSKPAIGISIDLVAVQNDKVRVEVSPPAITTAAVTYHFARVIPGTYAIAEYGRFVEGIRAFDAMGKSLPIARLDSDTVKITDARKLARLTYLVNDTFYNETGEDVFSSKNRVIFSPAGTNILAGKQFLLNLCGFAGYFSDMEEHPYQVMITHLLGNLNMTEKYAVLDYLSTAADADANYKDREIYRFSYQCKTQLKNSWLKN
jgi:hypothetical protein